METKQIINWLRDKADRGPNHSWTRMLNMAADRLDELEQRLFVQRELSERQRWIPVDERLPECECIAIGFQSEMLIGWVGADANSDTGYCAESDGEILGNVTHWMPLPEPPKEVQE